LLTNITNHPLGVYTGKMGWCLYLFIMANRYNKENWNMAAEDILCSIFKDIDSVSSINLSDGLAGIGLSISYLIEQKYVDGDINRILKDVDNAIFRTASSSKYQIDCSDMIDTLYYFVVRIKQQDIKSENHLLFCDLIIYIINNIAGNLHDKCFEVPFLYTLDYKLPFFLYVLSKVWSLNIYNTKIQKIIDELSDKVLSTIPRIYAHRLYFMWRMVSLNKHLQNKEWEKQIKLLQEQIDLKYIIDKELKSGNIFFHNGVSSIYFFLKSLKDYFSLELLDWSNNLIKEKIEYSIQWKLFENDSPAVFQSFANFFSIALFLLSEISNTE
jgi:hypothetical protein